MISLLLPAAWSACSLPALALRAALVYSPVSLVLLLLTDRDLCTLRPPCRLIDLPAFKWWPFSSPWGPTAPTATPPLRSNLLPSSPRPFSTRSLRRSSRLHGTYIHKCLHPAWMIGAPPQWERAKAASFLTCLATYRRQVWVLSAYECLYRPPRMPIYALMLWTWTSRFCFESTCLTG